MNLLKRETYLSKIRPWYEKNYILALTGIRRCGKSELLKQIQQEIVASGVPTDHILSFDLEGKSGKGLKDLDSVEQKLDHLIQDQNRYYVFFDEVQHLKDFETVLAYIRDSYNVSLFVTGSNSKLLHGKLQDRLTGRAKEFVIRPFSYQESRAFRLLNHLPIAESPNQDLLNYLAYGGMPQRYDGAEEDIYPYLKGIYESIVEKDIYANHKGINRNAFERFSRYLISTTGRVFSALPLAKAMDPSASIEKAKSHANVLTNYANYCSEAYFIEGCTPYYLQGKAALSGLKKYYAIDTGLRNALSADQRSYDIGFSLENAVFNELRSRGYEVSYGKLRNGEVDFVVSKNRRHCFIQVCYLLSSDEIKAREYQALEKIQSRSPSYVLSMDEFDWSENGIAHLNAFDFLTGKQDIVLL